MKKVSHAELVNIISNVRGCKFAHITTNTEVKVKRDCPFQNVRKVTSRRVQINYGYENAVNNHLERNGEQRNFVGGSLPWGAWLIPNKVIEHKLNLYLRTYEPANASETSYYVLSDGRMANDHDTEVINAYAYAKSYGSEKQANFGLTYDEQVKPKAVSFDSIVEISINGEKYQIV